MPDPYVYSGTNVLINKFDIQDQEKLAEVENDLVYIKLFEVDDYLSKKEYNIATLKGLHSYLFQDIYDWAGKFRVINIRKIERVIPGTSVEYCDHTMIQTELSKAIKELSEIKWENLSLREKASVFSKIFAKIWQIHPFREGNTRTITTFMLGYAKSKGVEIDGSLLAKYSAYVRESLVMASIGIYSEYEHLEKIILDAMGGNADTQADTEQTHNQYTQIKDYEVKEYYYRHFDAEE